MQMNSSFRSARRDPTIPLTPDRRSTILSGSATHTSTDRNSNGACTHEAKSKRVNNVKPPISETSVKVAPRLKKPSKPAVSNENAVSKKCRVGSRIGGVHRTFAIIQGYRKENTTGTQLFAKTSNITVTLPKALAARTGTMALVLSRNAINSRNSKENAIRNVPASEPVKKASRVAPNALSMNFMAETPVDAGFVIREGFS